jgi:hypothetical protein
MKQEHVKGVARKHKQNTFRVGLGMGVREGGEQRGRDECVSLHATPK